MSKVYRRGIRCRLRSGALRILNISFIWPTPGPIVIAGRCKGLLSSSTIYVCRRHLRGSQIVGHLRKSLQNRGVSLRVSFEYRSIRCQLFLRANEGLMGRGTVYGSSGTRQFQWSDDTPCLAARTRKRETKLNLLKSRLVYRWLPQCVLSPSTKCSASLVNLPAFLALFLSLNVQADLIA